ncbi:alpha/beta fold hydrolase [Rugosimonospora acidiphila]|uniref:Alpha/beta fold hydrolase n=1 Tax=Rugosimonospora acidiphila TaxID=556531 RepID=A0ABP9RU08_9ACTN
MESPVNLPGKALSRRGWSTRRGRLRTVTVVATAAAVVTVGATSGFAAQARAQPGQPASATSRSSCPELPGVQSNCGTIEVPLDRADPAAGQTAIRYLLLRHRGTGKSAGTVALNEGGPGIAWIPALAQQPQAFLAEFGAILNTHDLLLMDPRGTGGSGPRQCRALSITSIPSVRSQLVDAVAACGRELGTDTRFYTTAATADDLDAVRAHLGIGKLDLLGESYGTYLMTVYAGRHPERVHSVILSSAMPLDLDMWQRTNAQAMRRAIDLMCQRSGGTCDGNRVLADLGTLADRLHTRPVPYNAPDGPRTMDDTALAAITYDLVGVRDQMGQLPGMVTAALHGDYAPLTTAAAAVFPPPPSDQAPRQAGPSTPPTGSTSSDGQAADQVYGLVTWASVSCNDYPTLWDRRAPVPTRTHQYDQARDRLNQATFAPFTPQAWTDGIYNAGNFCLRWPDRDVAAQATDLPLPNVPVLVLSGDLDANTPTADGRAAAQQYPHAQLIEVPNTGHVPEADPQANSCVTGLQSEFLATGKVTDTGCLATIPPISVQ